MAGVLNTRVSTDKPDGSLMIVLNRPLRTIVLVLASATVSSGVLIAVGCGESDPALPPITPEQSQSKQKQILKNLYPENEVSKGPRSRGKKSR
jgi:hypothetical protein